MLFVNFHYGIYQLFLLAPVGNQGVVHREKRTAVFKAGHCFVHYAFYLNLHIFTFSNVSYAFLVYGFTASILIFFGFLLISNAPVNKNLRIVIVSDHL